jgi:anti-sigma B factor antagonist
MPAFSVCGDLDVSTAATVRAELTDLLSVPGTDDLIVDLEHMGSLDTVGLGLLVGIHRQAQRGGRRLVLTRVPPRMMRVLAVTRLRRVLAIDEGGPELVGAVGGASRGSLPIGPARAS